MEHMDMIDKLKEKAGISREEAADALTRANWDMLEALLILEKEGRIAPLTSSVVTAGGNTGTQGGYGFRDTGVRTSGDGFGEKLKGLLRNSVAYSLLVRREGKVIISLPVLVFLIILLAAFQLTAVAMLIGLFLGCRYSLEKRDGTPGGGDESEGF